MGLQIPVRCGDEGGLPELAGERPNPLADPVVGGGDRLVLEVVIVGADPIRVDKFGHARHGIADRQINDVNGPVGVHTLPALDGNRTQWRDAIAKSPRGTTPREPFAPLFQRVPASSRPDPSSPEPGHASREPNGSTGPLVKPLRMPVVAATPSACLGGRGCSLTAWASAFFGRARRHVGRGTSVVASDRRHVATTGSGPSSATRPG